MALVGAAPDSLAPRCPVTATDLEQSYAAVPDEGRLAVVHPGATDPRRRWPAEKFAAVADALIEAGARVLLIGDQSERAVASAVLRHMRGTAADLCGQLSLQALVGVLSRARVVVANDSGPVHLAEAAGAATVGIYWCFNFINGAPLTRTRHRPFIAWQQKCPQCGRDCLTGRCRHECSFVADVQESDVIAAALDLLD